MLPNHFLAASLLAAAAGVFGQENAANISTACDGPTPSEDFLAILDEFEASEESNITKRDASETFYVDLYVHVIAAGQSLYEGYLERHHIDQEISKLNQYFAPAGFVFQVKDFDRNIWPGWLDFQSRNMQQIIDHPMKQHLFKGDSSSLNIYFVHRLEDDGFYRTTGNGGWQMRVWGTHGIATFPTGQARDWRDGVFVSSLTVPGTLFPDFKGFPSTLAHEVGHSMGLLHTDRGGCWGENDRIKDTPAHQTFTGEDCPLQFPDTCPGDGPDPIDNLMMSYNNPCQSGFTNGQNTRMRHVYRSMRLSNQGQAQAPNQHNQDRRPIQGSTRKPSQGRDNQGNPQQQQQTRRKRPWKEPGQNVWACRQTRNEDDCGTFNYCYLFSNPHVCFDDHERRYG